MSKMEMIDVIFHRLYDTFVAEGGLDQVTHLVDEDWERMQRMRYCVHALPRQSCPFCKRTFSSTQ